MQHSLKYLLTFFLAMSCQPVLQVLPPIPDASYAKGVSAPFCGVLDGCLIVAGGANFPGKPLLEGGEKKVYDDVWRFDGVSWTRIASMADSTAYGATFQLPGALVFAGGTGRTAVYRLGRTGIEALPPLPVPVDQAGAAVCGDRLFLAGAGFLFSCRAGEWEWRTVAALPEPLVQPVAFASGEWLYLWGGFNPETLELPLRGWKMRIGGTGAWEEGPAIPDGGTFVGAAAAPLPDGRLAVAGGVNRDIFHRALRNTPEDRIPYLSREPAAYRFSRKVYVFDPSEEAWSLLLEDASCALAGPGLACADNLLYVVGGELKPGIRSHKIFTLKLNK